MVSVEAADGRTVEGPGVLLGRFGVDHAPASALKVPSEPGSGQDGGFLA